MKKHLFIHTIIFFFILGLCYSCSDKTPTKDGIIGIYYSEGDLTAIKDVTVLTSLTQLWDESVDFQGGSSGIWKGNIIAPTTGTVTFYMNTNQKLLFTIDGKELNIDSSSGDTKYNISMEKNKEYPVIITFWNPGHHSYVGMFSIEWSWQGSEKSEITSPYITYGDKEIKNLKFVSDPDPDSIDKSQFIYPEVKNVVVHYAVGRFAAWPANNGIWIWEDEILVGFLYGFNKENKYHHAIDQNKPMAPAFARSLDGGETWSFEESPANLAYGVKPTKLKEKINYGAPGFALKNRDDFFYYSYGKGKNWRGPFSYPDLGIGKLTSRTDYFVEGPESCFIFTSAKDDRVRAALQDHAVCIRTDDGGESFEVVGWMSELDSVRSVMPATVRVDENHLISALRRRLDPPKVEAQYSFTENWIDIYESFDNGLSWHFLAKIANTDTGKRNGNPPSLVRLPNGLLCVVYGYRGIPYSIRAKVSIDNGKTWSKEIILRDDARIWDIGYLRSVVRKDNKVVSTYYYSTNERTERHIEATIWDPNNLLSK